MHSLGRSLDIFRFTPPKTALYAVSMATQLPSRRGLSKPTPWAIAFTQVLMVMLAALPVTAQITPVAHASNASVSDAEVTAFMQAQQKDMKAMLTIRDNPKRVPLLLAAIQRDPAGPWASLLQGICFVEDRASAWRLPPAPRSQVYARAIDYLSTAEATISKAMERDRQNQQLKYNLKVLDGALALARVESVTRTNDTRAIAGSRPTTNTIPRVDSIPPGGNPAPGLRAQACRSNLKQIDLSKEMWKADHNKPETASPTVADLTNYLPYRQFPKCPDGGT